MNARRAVGVGAAVTLALAGLIAVPVFGSWMSAPAGFAAGCLVAALVPGLLRDELLAGVPGGVSLAATAGAVAFGTPPAPQSVESGWSLVESAALLGLVILVTRRAPARRAAICGGLAAVAVPVLLLRFFGGDTFSAAALGGLGTWGLVALLAAGVGLYLRSLDARRSESVAAAHREQRLSLARDLHDFVAHDVSGILAQAQAGQIVARSDPDAAVSAFQRIERAAQQALASMDQTVLGPAARAPMPGLAELPELVDRFTAAGGTEVRLDLDPTLEALVPREEGMTVYRVVAESLTNVRRHAAAAGRVRIAVRPKDCGITVTVTDDAHAAGPGRRRSGLGLPGLTERVRALGGTLTAGPAQPRGWRVAAELPLRGTART